MPASQKGGQFIPHQPSALRPLSERANQVANSDVDTCPFGTGTETATQCLEILKHPVSKQQLSAHRNLGKTCMGHAGSQLPILQDI